MVWVHGGALQRGSGSYRFMKPDYLVEKDVVVVAVNYRLGALGFLNLGHPAAPGNQGLKDIIAALRWTQENIAKFGGDPNNVTLCGQSAGALLTHASAISPKAKGLIHKAIMQSGTMLSPWGIGQSRPKRGFKLASLLGINSTDPEEVVDLLRQLPDKDIVKLETSVLSQKEIDLYDIPFGVNYDEFAEDPVLPLPLSQLCSNDANIPIMAGQVTYEGLMLCYDDNKSAMDAYETHLFDMVQTLGSLKNLGPAEVDQLHETVKKVYFPNPSLSNILERYLHFGSDAYFTIPLRLYVEDRLKRATAATYYYWFTYLGNEKTYTDILNYRKIKASSHMDELVYLFYWPLCKVDNPSPPAIGTDDRAMIERMTTLWTNFIKTGNPTPCKSDVVNVTWEPATKDNFRCYQIDRNCEMLTLKPTVVSSNELIVQPNGQL
ncbi:esterase FE4-like isoform X2 [Hylaeus volcanicus]|nr:esterase FE4-like isoform X2 [Hylaeus volcanicus]